MARRPRGAAALILCAAISAALMPGGARAQEVRHATWGITFPTSQSGRVQDEFLNGLTAYHLCMFEYACHEGNYAMEHVLKGARYQERAASGQAPAASPVR